MYLRFDVKQEVSYRHERASSALKFVKVMLIEFRIYKQQNRARDNILLLYSNLIISVSF